MRFPLGADFATESSAERIVSPEDEQYTQAAERGDRQFTEPGNTIAGNFAVQRGTVVRGSDRNVYVVRWTTPARVYAVSPSGEFVRNFEVQPPIEGKKPGTVVSRGGRLAIEWEASENDPRSDITVVGLDGQPYATYEETIGDLVCYSGQERFTFIGQAELRFAEPRVTATTRPRSACGGVAVRRCRTGESCTAAPCS